MFLHITKAEHVEDYVLHITFNNAESGTVDLQGELYGEMFAPLLDVEKFRDFRVDEEIDTVVWGNGADFAPEFFYEKMKERRLYVAEEPGEYRARK